MAEDRCIARGRPSSQYKSVLSQDFIPVPSTRESTHRLSGDQQEPGNASIRSAISVNGNGRTSTEERAAVDGSNFQYGQSMAAWRKPSSVKSSQDKESLFVRNVKQESNFLEQEPVAARPPKKLETNREKCLYCEVEVNISEYEKHIWNDCQRGGSEAAPFVDLKKGICLICENPEVRTNPWVLLRHVQNIHMNVCSADKLEEIRKKLHPRCAIESETMEVRHIPLKRADMDARSTRIRKEICYAELEEEDEEVGRDSDDLEISRMEAEEISTDKVNDTQTKLRAKTAHHPLKGFGSSTAASLVRRQESSLLQKPSEESCKMRLVTIEHTPNIKLTRVKPPSSPSSTSSEDSNPSSSSLKEQATIQASRSRPLGPLELPLDHLKALLHGCYGCGGNHSRLSNACDCLMEKDVFQCFICLQIFDLVPGINSSVVVKIKNHLENKHCDRKEPSKVCCPISNCGKLIKAGSLKNHMQDHVKTFADFFFREGKEKETLEEEIRMAQETTQVCIQQVIAEGTLESVNHFPLLLKPRELATRAPNRGRTSNLKRQKKSRRSSAVRTKKRIRVPPEVSDRELQKGREEVGRLFNVDLSQAQGCSRSQLPSSEIVVISTGSVESRQVLASGKSVSVSTDQGKETAPVKTVTGVCEEGHSSVPSQGTVMPSSTMVSRVANEHDDSIAFPREILALIPPGLSNLAILTYGIRPSRQPNLPIVEADPVARIAEYFGMSETVAAYLPDAAIMQEGGIACLCCDPGCDSPFDMAGFMDHICLIW